MMKVGRFLLGIRIEASGLERLDRRVPYVFMCNHLSFLDAPMLVTVVDRPVRFIVKRFVFRIPVLGLGMRFSGYVPLDNEGVGEGRKLIARASRLNDCSFRTQSLLNWTSSTPATFLISSMNPRISSDLKEPFCNVASNDGGKGLVPRFLRIFPSEYSISAGASLRRLSSFKTSSIS
ncbi:MAG: 1-acyl-sn-glycerol-3-phosphate acyltransferase, partial [Candidatus Aminicenantes bacterium]|nr:1-acyl-sn-glycerol-3-phosphate acyltransferase [Candidatus Aminicenantes bacterium]